MDYLSMGIGQKILLIRKHEGLSRATFSEITGISADTLKGYESGKSKTVHSTALEKIARNPQFQKYTLWLLTGESNLVSGQVSPDTSENTADSGSFKNSIIETVFMLINTDLIKLGDNVKVTHVTDAIFDELNTNNPVAFPIVSQKTITK